MRKPEVLPLSPSTSMGFEKEARREEARSTQL
jgi:hypothetical protein